jgi:hypothetical protein
MALINIKKIKLISRLIFYIKNNTVNIKTFIIFILKPICYPFINIICEKIIYHTFRLNFIGKIMTYQKKICIIYSTPMWFHDHH